MSRLIPALRLLCLGLLAVIAAQTAGLVREGDPLLVVETEPPAASGEPPTTASSEPAATSVKEASSPVAKDGAVPNAPGPAPQPALPDRFKAIDASGIFGSVPVQKIVPTLIGMAGKYAILQTPDGAVGLVAEGGEQGGVKVLKIDINRALIEFEGKQQELTLFSGLGSSSLLPQEKDKNP